jgi:hypothetical protein
VSHYGPPTRERLVERLRQLNQDVPDDADAQMLADIINQALCDQAVACRALIDGKPKVAKFCDYWAAVFNQKWKYVRHEERGLLEKAPL